MNNLSVIIPSKSAINFLTSSNAVRTHEPNARILLVDDGVGPLVGPDHNNGFRLWSTIEGDKPFIFARNVNIGIRVADADDVVILNDDAILQTPYGFSKLQKAAEEHPEYGIIAATTNCVGNQNQWPQGIGLREDPRMVCFVAVFIPRTTIEKVGLLDERYTGYGMDDDDYCLRVRQAGLKIGIHDGCFVDHKSLPSSFRGAAGAGGDYRPNLEIFKQKWGMDNWGRPA